VVTVEISLIGMILAVVAVIFLGLSVPPRYALLSGGLIGIGGVWLVGTVPSVSASTALMRAETRTQ
jgi:hypothetical protein